MTNVVIALENEGQTIWLNKVEYDCADFIGGGVFVSGDGIPTRHLGDAVAEQGYDKDQDQDGWWANDWFLDLNGHADKPKHWRRLMVVAATPQSEKSL
jgi:hypothetical protein